MTIQLGMMMRATFFSNPKFVQFLSEPSLLGYIRSQIGSAQGRENRMHNWFNEKDRLCCEYILIFVSFIIAIIFGIIGICFMVTVDFGCPVDYIYVTNGYCINQTIYWESIEKAEILFPRNSTGKQFLIISAVTILIGLYGLITRKVIDLNCVFTNC